MVFPEQESLRRTQYAIASARYVLEYGPQDSSVVVDRDALVSLVKAAISNGIKTPHDRNYKRATIAGNYLVALYLMSSFPKQFKLPSVSKAIYIAKKYAKTTTYRDETLLTSSESEIRKCIIEFKSVAHLWGARLVLESYPGEAMFATQQSVVKFLGVAGALQDFGCTFRPPAPKNKALPLLDQKTIWRVPDSIARLYTHWERPSDFMVQAMKTYKARQRGSL